MGNGTMAAAMIAGGIAWLANAETMRIARVRMPVAVQMADRAERLDFTASRG
jgi:hypothetical protein